MRKVLCAAAALAALAACAWASPLEISYVATQVAAERWQYTYTVENIALAPAIDEFTIWFDYGLYSNLALPEVALGPGGWSEVIVQPDPLFHDDGFYDALATGGGLLPGGSETGFTVLFDWHGTGTPGAQRFDIVDPVTFTTVYSGTTVPEPAAVALFGFTFMLTRRRRLWF
jgi:hypothetical protein